MKIQRGDEGLVMDTFDLEALPKGAISRLWLEISQDELGRPRMLPIMVARGERPGPTFGLTSAVHGDELNGIRVIHRLFERLDMRTLRGSVVGVVVVNIPGYLAQTRLFGDRMDLNHLFPGNARGNAAEVYAHRLVQGLVSKFDYLVDMHTASIGRINSLYIRADMTHPVAAQMAYLQRPQIIVHNPASDKTLRGTAMELDIPAITLEIGNPLRFQPQLIKRSLTGLRAVLADVGMVPRRKIAPGPEPILCESSSWMYTDRGGLLQVLPDIVEQVEAGDVVARQLNIFGDVAVEYRTEEAGVIIGKSHNPSAEAGARILHLGRLAHPDDDRFHRRTNLPSSEDAS